MAKKDCRDILVPHIDRYCNVVGFTRPNLKYDQQSINYLTTSVITNIKVNVQEHFVKMLVRFINYRLDVKNQQKRLLGAERMSFFARLRYLKQLFLLDDIPQTDDLDLSNLESALLEDIWNILLDRVIGKEGKLAYLVACDPLSFFPSHCALSRLFERCGLPLFNAIPLRRSFIQSHVRIDTMILYQHVLKVSWREYDSVDKMDLWLRVCNLGSKAFTTRSGMAFDGSITTDGTSMSVCLKHPDAAKYGRHKHRNSEQAIEADIKSQYIENNLTACRSASNVVTIDPNKRDILYCRDLQKRQPKRLEAGGSKNPAKQ
ncbi:uncharacterized protein SPPG_09290 [Spizellomyces punctatus DAOM BR117]|uniref:Uncharacterized protein n=1 Tax=Spizellomyces punctatus (strain DAOM BR117) TaxID=645134 RepID=A0A0L0HED3_SPIPD|nr:uncharacterized protein SPPG_09290 [Spizellomyces punctatus DAOM BR117]KNC99339.1 hypothetical protein SPPG_09290 [Spizellomyces punctatus DAOM BR117]|eukprot:XP_016607379.1 hypothetical protein SPPG_09290 [Spizellomyces punctatus DAOM BR117]